jgi:putative endonuclease
MNKKSYIYILSNIKNSVIYVGMTANLEKRIYAHKQKTNQGFTFKYNVTKLVYFEKFPDIYQAINREKQIKKWSRKAKDRLIQTMNPTWKDLF